MTDYKALTEVARTRYKLACDEMDRITAGSPGTTWRWSIPANPDRDSDLILSASAEDVPRLADAVEALVAENEKLRERLSWSETQEGGVRDDLANLEAERDALRAQLDAMTTEWVTTVEYAYGSLDAPDIITPTGEDIDDLGTARYNAEEFWISVLQRTVKRGPWVEVSE